MKGTCPECLRDVFFQGPTFHDSGRLLEDEREFFFVWICPNCQARLWRAERRPGGAPAEAGRLVGQWPLPGLTPPHPSYPPAVAADWQEAHTALAVGLRKSAAAMTRRAVQGICLDKKANPKKPLSNQIDELGQSQMLHPRLVEWAHQIRLFGNMGAHPGEDGLENVSEEEAKGAVAFLDELLRFTYELPDRLDKLRAGATP